jgi:hypothetical protein
MKVETGSFLVKLNNKDIRSLTDGIPISNGRITIFLEK